MKVTRFLVLCIILSACKHETKTEIVETPETKQLELKYAKGFSVDDYGTYKILNILKPWPESKTHYSYGLLGDDASVDLKTEVYDGIINTSISKIVVTSTTHIPALELLGVEQTLVGFPGMDYISSEKTRQRIADGNIRELGKNEGINTEVLLELNPDIVVGFGVEGINKTFETIKKAGIPVV